MKNKFPTYIIFIIILAILAGVFDYQPIWSKVVSKIHLPQAFSRDWRLGLDLVGGSILTYGSKPEGGAWQIAVTDPLDPSESVGVLTLDGGHCVSTSGDYERYVEVDGVRYHHILDPRTGSPAHSDVAGVTIVTKDGFLSDALSTACFVLGQEEGQKLLEKYDAEGLFINHEGTITMTEGMRQYFHLSNSQK